MNQRNPRTAIGGAIVAAGAIALLLSAAEAALPDGFPVTDGLSLYLDTDELEIESGRVLRMIDRSGNGNDAREGDASGLIVEGAPTLPKLKQNATPSGLDAIEFDGIGGYVEVGPNPADFDGRAKTSIVVFRPRELGTGRMINFAYEELGDVGEPRYTNHSMFASPRNGGVLRFQNRTATGGAVTDETSGGTVTAGSYFIGSNTWFSSGDTVGAVVNQANQRFVRGISGADAVNQGHLWTRIGASGNFNTGTPESFFDGEIAAVLVYNRDLDPFELMDVEQYLYNLYLSGVQNPADPGVPITDGLVLHLNAANAELDGTVVTAMYDISGRGNDGVSKIHEGERLVPTVAQGAAPFGRDAVRFDGVEQYLQTAPSPAHFDGRERTTMVIFRPEEYGGGRIINFAWSDLDPNPNELVLHHAAHTMWAPTGTLRIQNRTFSGGAISVSAPADSVDDTANFYLGANICYDDGRTEVVVRNQANERFASETSGALSDPTGNIFVRLGAGSSVTNPGPANHFNGDIVAVVVFNRALPADELEQVEEFLYNYYLKSDEEPLEGFFAWVDSFGLAGDDASPDASPGGDGLTNLAKYAFGIDNPQIPARDSERLPVTGIDEQNHLTLTVTKNPAATDVAFIIEASADLLEWSVDGIEIVEDTSDLLVVRLASPSDRGFLRLSLSLIE